MNKYQVRFHLRAEICVKANDESEAYNKASEVYTKEVIDHIESFTLIDPYECDIDEECPDYFEFEEEEDE